MKKLIFFCLITFIVLPMFAILFLTASSYPPRTSKAEEIISNSYALREAVPPQVYSHTINVLTRYRDRQKQKSTTYSIQAGNVLRMSDGYYFVLLPNSQDEKEILVELSLKNYGNFFGITVDIDGETQGI